MLTALLLIPVIAALLVGFGSPRGAQKLALGASALTLLLSLVVLFGAGGRGDLLAVTDQVPAVRWIPGIASYHLGADAPAALLVVLTALLHTLVIWYSDGRVTLREREYYLWLLLLEGAVIGSFLARDVVLFYLFFELALVPAYFLVGIWGGPRRVQAATKFFVYTVVGSLLMLASIISLFLYTRGGMPNGGMDVERLRVAVESVSPTAAVLMFVGFAIAFAVKTGVFPFHTWLPDTYAEAPAPVTVLLSGVLAKLGTYGFYRFCLYLFPGAAAEVGPFLVALGVVSIVYGALVAAVQRDAKRVLAYSSVSHLGFVVAGLFSLNSIGTAGALLQMFNHGITSGALFFAMAVIEQRRGTTHIRALGGLWEQMPLFGRLFLIATLSSVALPLTNGFVGEFLILLGTFQTQPWLAAIGTTGVIFSAVYMLWMFQRVMYGPVARPEVRRMADITGSERGVLYVLAALIFLLGVYPAPVQKLLERSVNFTVPQAAEGREGAGTPLASVAPHADPAHTPAAEPAAEGNDRP